VHTAEVRVHFAALLVSLVRAGMTDAAAALRDWALEYLYDDQVDDLEHFEEELDLDDTLR
jgi:hypothetical protein